MNKKILIKDIIKGYSTLKEVKSVNFVGSFAKTENYSDIDIVIIVEQLNKDIFNQCNDIIKKIDLKKHKIKKKIYINNTFGPLKFDTDKYLVFHLMIYNIDMHISHVIESPFTCYDWERNASDYGINLKDIFSVGKLNLTDFINKYRGINNYKKNIINESIDYKEFFFTKKNFVLKKKKFKINKKLLIEFSYHIISNLCNNLLKFEYSKNKKFSEKEIIKTIKKVFINKNYKEKINFFKILKKNKINNETSFNYKYLKSSIIEFIDTFEKYILILYKAKKTIIFKRHFQTKYKKEVFLGRKLNPNIILDKKNHKFNKYKDLKAITSPMLRTVKTAREMGIKKIIKNDLINEIDYGKVEGKNLDYINQIYPYIIKNWRNKKDVRFPGGESSSDVQKRLIKFVNYLINFLNRNNDQKIIIITHNVVMRTLLGIYYELPKHKWFLLDIDYGDEIQFYLIKDKIYPNFDRKKMKIFFKKIYENSYINKTKS